MAIVALLYLTDAGDYGSSWEAYNVVQKRFREIVVFEMVNKTG